MGRQWTAALLWCCAISLMPASLRGDEFVRIKEGSVLWDRPGPHGRSVVRVQTPVEVEVLEEGWGWARVRYLDRSGWIQIDATEVFDNTNARFACPPNQAAWNCKDLGWVLLITDIEASDHRQQVEMLLADLPGKYQSRYGGSIEAGGKAWIGVFQDVEEFERFEQRHYGAGPGHSWAWASGTLATVLVSSVNERDLLAIEHEGVHLLNRLAFGPQLPTWLEEGSAGCLGLLEPEGGIRGHTKRRPVLIYHDAGWAEERSSVSHHGPRAALARVGARAMDGSLDLQEVVGRSRRDFYALESRGWRYELSAVTVCFLTDYLKSEGAPNLADSWRQNRLAASIEKLASGDLRHLMAEWVSAILKSED